MRRQWAAVFGVAAAVMSAGIAPSASAQPGTYNPEAQFFRTAGNVRCVVSAEKAACERVGGFHTAPTIGAVASVDADGKFSWAEAGIGPTVGQEIAMVDGQVYRAHDWSLLLSTEGTRLSNDTSVHGMNVSIDGVTVTPY